MTYVTKRADNFATVVIVNEAGEHTPDLLTLHRWARAAQVAIDTLFAPYWHVGANILPPYAVGEPLPRNAILVHIGEDYGVPHAGGYHTVNASTGLAECWVQLGLLAANGYPPEAGFKALVHEIMEALARAYFSMVAMHVRPDGQVELVDMECCDPLNDFRFDVTISEFDADGHYVEFTYPAAVPVWPNWYQDGTPGPWDGQGRCGGPFDIPFGFTGGEGRYLVTITGGEEYVRKLMHVGSKD